jgi:carbon starvation protein CstA
MKLFLLGLAILILGYIDYGKLVEKILGPDDRETPAKKLADGLDYVVLPHWKNLLIQLLNIAGVGPVIGVILGIKFGVIAFVLIPIGNIIGGAVHDFIAGMMSLRNNGANLPELIRITLGKKFYQFFAIFMCLLLLLVVAVFINIPAQLIEGLAPSDYTFWIAAIAIFLYYIGATLFPVDKIIGKLYPLFGALLLVGTFAIFAVLIVEVIKNPALLEESVAFKQGMFTAEKNNPILPMLFVTIACGILSGFHATQSPIIARTMKSEREAKSSFYGMMVLEGIIGMIWAAAGLAIYNLKPALMAKAPAAVLGDITTTFLGSTAGTITVLSVIILSITSGDTAMRSLRLSLGEIFKINQVKIFNRIALCLPLIAIVSVLLWWSNASAKSFGFLWNYFAWGNQVLAVFTLTAGTVWLAAKKKPVFITAIPGTFITFVILTYILWISPAHGGPFGLGLELNHAYIIAGALSVIIMFRSIRRGKEMIGQFED